MQRWSNYKLEQTYVLAPKVALVVITYCGFYDMTHDIFLFIPISVSAHWEISSLTFHSVCDMRLAIASRPQTSKNA